MPADPPDRELDALLELLGRRRFLIHRFAADQHGPSVLAATRNLGGAEDVAVLFDPDHAVAWRCPTGPDVDVLAPTYVFWSYAARPTWTLRALITLAPPGHPDAPALLVAAPPGVGLPSEGRLPVTITARMWQ